eukprot:8237374-Pyramimonas_sp.AAC.2
MRRAPPVYEGRRKTSARAPITEVERAYTRSGHQSRKGTEHIPVAGTNRVRGERIYPSTGRKNKKGFSSSLSLHITTGTPYVDTDSAGVVTSSYEEDENPFFRPVEKGAGHFCCILGCLKSDHKT